MSIRNLDALFKPRSIALIGASNEAAKVGRVIADNLFNGGFSGPIMPVNPHHPVVRGVISYADVASLPHTPDLAVVATPAATIPALAAELAARGTRALVVISTGFGGAAGSPGAQLKQALLDAARPHCMRIVGPNCLGLLVPGSGLNASFAHMNARPGRLAFLTQSGAIVTSLLDWAAVRGIGFSHLVSLGEMADVDFGDLLDYLANDPDTDAILLYIEAVTAPRKFISAARAAARLKPLIVVKGGRHAEGARAAASHTGAMAGDDAVYEAIFRRTGMLRVDDLEALFGAAEIVAMSPRITGDRLAILTNGGGMGVLATDALMDAGGTLAELAPATLAALDQLLPASWSRSNPVDIIGDAPGSRYAAAYQALAADPGIDALLALNCPTAVASSLEAAQALIAARGTASQPLLFTSWVGAASMAEARAGFARARIPSYDTPEQAVRAFSYMVDHAKARQLLLETPPSIPEQFTPDEQQARRLIDAALAEGRQWLLEPEAKALFEAYAIATVPTRRAATPAEAAAIAAQFAVPVALKVLSPDLPHKSDVGGVQLDLATPAAVQEAAAAMLARLRKSQPQARIEGFCVEPMTRRPNAFELIIGAFVDPQFGPVILFGQGGTAVELIRDRSLELPPLNMRLAHELINRTRLARLLRGYRDHPAVNLDAVALSLIKLAQMVTDLPELVELEINPLLADAEGVIALDARVRLRPSTLSASQRLAIRPYPKALESRVTLGDGRALLLRPIRPEDEPALQAALLLLTPEQQRLRRLLARPELDERLAARLTQIDYDREMALVLTETTALSDGEIFGVVRLMADPDNESAEFAIMLRPELSGQGVGRQLMERLIDHARDRGIGQLYGDVLPQNQSMRRLCAALGFVEARSPLDDQLLRVSLPLRNPT
jgi:acetyltransferase